MKDFKKSAIYQIYPKSFMDSNGDGFGDINGITQKLDYLQYLGVDYIWLTPIFVSPQNDNGYDVADYYTIDPRYGTMEDLEIMITEAEKRNINVMFDMVFNHTSTEHKWFQKALQGDEKYKNYYIFKKGKGENNPPTNWVSKFGGSAWEYVEKFDEYYLHLFDKTQADLNWENEEVRSEVIHILKYWIEKGIKGFRFDVVNLISKAGFKDDVSGDGRNYYTDGPHVHEYLKELNKNGLSYCDDCITVGEMSSTTIENCVKYAGAKENELSMVFSFHHLKVDYKDKYKWGLMPFDFMELKQLLNDWQIGMQNADAWNALFWCNHDQPRAISRFGNDKKYWKESGKMLATVIHCLRGTPYIYQGEEIGMTNAYFKNIQQYRDVESQNYFHILKESGLSENEIYHVLQERSRDNSRTPMQWDDSRNAGFTTGTPWIDVISNYPSINVENNKKDTTSILEHYRKLIQIRKTYSAISEGNFIPLMENHTSVYAYKRIYKNETIIVINNFFDKNAEVSFDFDITKYQCILSNYNNTKLENSMILKPYESFIAINIS